MTNSETVRRLLLDRIKLDLMGPLYGNNEILSEEIELKLWRKLHGGRLGNFGGFETLRVLG